MVVFFQMKGTYNLPLLICLFLAWVWDFLFLAPHILFLYSAIWKENTKINCSSRFKGKHDVSPIGKYSATKNKPFIWLIYRYTATLITSYFLEFEIHFFFWTIPSLKHLLQNKSLNFLPLSYVHLFSLLSFCSWLKRMKTDTKSIPVYI